MSDSSYESMYRTAQEKVAKLQKFKDWVHAYLDAKGVPTHPDGPHSKEGCRIGDRMDWVFERLGNDFGEDAVPPPLTRERSQKIDAAIEAVRDLADEMRFNPLTRERVAAAVEGLFRDGCKRSIDHLQAGDDDPFWWSRSGVVAHLCRELGAT